MFDTGSSNSWILTTEAAEKYDRKTRSQHNYYDKDLSMTYVGPTDMRKVKIGFGSGYLKGYFVHDRCTLGDIDDPNNQLILDNY